MSSRCTKESKYCNVIAATFSKKEIWQATKRKWLECMCDPFTLNISIAILLTDFHTINGCIVWRVWCWINVEPPDLYFCYSHHFSAWYCIDIVRRNSVLITHGSLRLIAETILHVLDILLISQSGFLLKKIQFIWMAGVGANLSFSEIMLQYKMWFKSGNIYLSHSTDC